MVSLVTSAIGTNLTNQTQFPISAFSHFCSSSSSSPSPSFVFSKLISLTSSNSVKSQKLGRILSDRVLVSTRNQALWEDPEDGSGSEYEEEEEDEDDLDFESQYDGGEETVASEIEQLLEPEERAILQQNATPNLAKISTAKWSPLHSLGLAGQIHHMDMLLDNGLNIDFVDKDGLTVLHTAIMGKKEAVISHLLRKGASPHVRDRDGASPLHYAVQVGALQTVKLLIKYNVDLNVEDNEGWTPLHIAIQSRNRYITKVLLVNGADQNRRNKGGKTPLDLALCYGKDFKSYDLAKLLKLVPANRDF